MAVPDSLVTQNTFLHEDRLLISSRQYSVSLAPVQLDNVVVAVLAVLDDGAHADGVHRVGIGRVRHVSPPPAVTWLAVGTLNRRTLIETDIDSSLKQNIVALGKLESSESCSEKVATIGCHKVLKQKRIHRTAL